MKNNFMGDIYTSYGPFVGKVCENTNTQLHQDNIIESITSSISHNSINISNHTSPIDGGIEIPKYNIIQDSCPIGPIGPIGLIDSILPIKTSQKLRGIKKIKLGGDINKQTIDIPIINKKSDLIDKESTSFFNYKISIYSHKISIWILLLILLVIICIGYFVYKYWYFKNTNIITYKKSNEINKTTIKELSSTETDNESEDNTTSSSSSNSTTK
jgi:hypothetical protein